MVQTLSGLVNALPADLLQDRETFDSIINRDLLEQIPQSKLTAILNKHLPASISEENKRKTASDLFDNNLHFLNINQMDHFYKQAKIHKFKPDLVKHLNELKSLKKKAYRLEEKKLQCKLLNEIIVKKRLLIKRALNNDSTVNRTDQLHHHHHHHHSNSSIAHLELTSRVDERYHKELEAIGLDSSLRLDELKPADSTDHNEVRTHPPASTTYSVDDQEYLRLLKNFKKKKLKNEVDEARFDDVSMKAVLDRVLENSPEFEAKLVSLNEQPKSNKRKKKVVKKPSATNKQRKVSNQAKPDSDHSSLTSDHQTAVQSAHQKQQVAISNDQQTPTIRAIKESTDFPPDASASGAKENEHINKLMPTVNQQEAPKPFSLNSIPPSVCSTDWIVKESTPTEKEEYRRQEVVRYRNPNKAFTFHLHNYKSVVGPVKNCTFIKESTKASKLKNRTTILKERPPHVTYLSLVRDSAARLPNGQGTRSDIVCLMKDSQYLREDLTDEQISGIVSGALDRLHYEVDPAVLYDSSSKLWVYCHRNRTEEQFNSLHEANLAKKVSQKAPRKSLNANKKVSQKAPVSPQISPKTVNDADDARPDGTSGDDRRDPGANNHQLRQPGDVVKIEGALPPPGAPVTVPPNSQLRPINISQAKLINLSHEDPKVNDYNINVKKHQPSKSLEIAKKGGSNGGKAGTKKATTAGKQIQIKPRINKPDDTATYTTTFSNLRLLNESIKQKFQKPAAKNLKTEPRSADEPNSESTRVIVSPSIGNEVRMDQAGLKQPANQQTQPSSNFTTLPISNSKPEKDEGKPIVMSNNAGISLCGANVILNPSNCPLILSSGANGYTAAFTMTKNGNQYFIYPQNTTISNSILKSKALAGQKIQTMQLVPFSSVQQAGQGLASKSQPIVAKIIPKPAQLSMTASSNQPTKPIICSPSLISTKAPNL